jgi:hypothetical protein
MHAEEVHGHSNILLSLLLRERCLALLIGHATAIVNDACNGGLVSG